MVFEHSLHSFQQRPSKRPKVLRPVELPGRHNLLPHRLDFPLVEAGASPSARGGVTSPPADAMVSAAIVQDTSGGRFAVVELQVFDVEQIDPPEGGPPNSLVFTLVMVNRTDGSRPVAVTRDQAVAAVVQFSAPAVASSDHFTATLEFSGDRWPSPVDLPITASLARSDPAVTWSLANPFGILANHDRSSQDPFQGNWFAGHVNAVLPVTDGSNRGALIVGANSGGVWIVRTATSDTPASAEPVSDAWESGPNVLSLVQGPLGPDHFYAGASGWVWETNPLHDASIRVWRPVSAKSFDDVFAMGIVRGTPNRIVAVTGVGVLWAEIPRIAGNVYNWQPVTKLTDGGNFPVGRYSGLAISSSRVVVAAFGMDDPLNRISFHGVFHGDWSSGELTMTRAEMPPPGPTDFTTVEQSMFRTSLAVCTSDPNVLYAVSSTDDIQVSTSDPKRKKILGPVLRSGDGGRSWTLLSPTTNGGTLSQAAGWQGDYNNCIAVAPNDSSTVVIGWQTGTFVSRDGGGTFRKLSNPNLHSDVHGLTFDPTDPSGQTLYIASDGGVAVTRDGGTSFDSSANRVLANLELYSTYPREFYGTLSTQGELIATGTQDNSNVVYQRTPAGDLTPWAPMDGGCDGGAVTFIATGQVLADLVCSGSGTNLWARALHGRSLYDIDAGAQVAVRGREGTTALLSPTLEAVTTPAFKNGDGELMYAVASPSGTLDVYGVFAKSDGSDLHAELIGSAPAGPKPDSVSALGSFDGTSVLIGTDSGRALQVTASRNGPVNAMAVTVAPNVPAGHMTRILTLSSSLAFANYNRNGFGSIVRFAGQSWVRADNGLSGKACYALAGKDPSMIFTGTDDGVFLSRDQGQSWAAASAGLPRNPSCSDMRIGTTPSGDVIYLSTFGRSLWVAALP